MELENLYAYTEVTPQGGYPGFVSVNKCGNEVRISVRSRGSQTPQQISLNQEQVAELSAKLAQNPA